MNFQQLSNLQYWSSLFSSPWSILINVIDILIVAYILYQFTKSIAGTKIMILVRGVLVFILAQIAANTLGLTTISWLINQLITYGVIAAVVIFSPEIRTGLERLGRATDFFSLFHPPKIRSLKVGSSESLGIKIRRSSFSNSSKLRSCLKTPL